MSDWDWRTIGQLVRQRKEGVPLEADADYRTMGVRWYGKGAYDRGRGSTETIKAKRLFRAHVGDFVFNRIDTQKGAFDVVPKDLDGSLVTNEFPLYEVDPEQALAEFLLLHFQQQAVLDSIGESRAGSEGRARWKEADFEAHRLRVPPLPVQRRITDLMSVVDRQIEALESESEGCALLLRAGRDELLGAFEVGALEDVLQVARAGGTPSRDKAGLYGGSIPWLKSGEVASPWIVSTSETLTEEGLEGSSAWLVPAHTVVVAMYGATAAQVGYLGVPMATNQAVLALRVYPDRADSRFLYHWMCARSRDLKKSATGAAQPNLSKSVVLAEGGFPRASLVEQQEWAKRLDAVSAHITTLDDETARLREFRSALLTSLMQNLLSIPESYDRQLEEVA